MDKKITTHHYTGDGPVCAAGIGGGEICGEPRWRHSLDGSRTTRKPPQNMFADAKHYRALLGETISAGSMCWVGGPPGDLEFDSERATVVLEAACERLREIGQEMLRDMTDGVERHANG